MEDQVSSSGQSDAGESPSDDGAGTQQPKAATPSGGGAGRWLKRIGLGVLGLVVVVGGGGGAYAYTLVSAFDESMEKEYDVAPLDITASKDPEVIARGKHLAESLAGCTLPECHGTDLGGGKVTDVGPLGTISSPNITPGSIASAYTDGELGRLIIHGIRKNGRSIRMMPVTDWNWLPKADVAAIVSYVRSVPTVDRANPEMVVGTVGKILDRRGEFPLDIARIVKHDALDTAPAPEPTAAYGRFVARLCEGCHGYGYSGGKIPGTPPDFPIPPNLTPHETGLAGWTYDDFVKMAETRVNKKGKQLVEFMPTQAILNMNETERKALWAFISTLPPKPFGGR